MGNQWSNLSAASSSAEAKLQFRVEGEQLVLLLRLLLPRRLGLLPVDLRGPFEDPLVAEQALHLDLEHSSKSGEDWEEGGSVPCGTGAAPGGAWAPRGPRIGAPSTPTPPPVGRPWGF